MSKNEVETAIKFADKYDLMLVENPTSDLPQVKHIKSPFKFKNGETLFENSKLTVLNDNYIVKFGLK
ncbi:hypothetical protein AGMMS49965_21830 [Bacteroidia bacterium]|nr:hypothetical protein AGMMS49965_21830 [Bacteroidia bacterium]